MHTEQQLESVQHLMTGAVQFKTDKQKTLVKGTVDKLGAILKRGTYSTTERSTYAGR